MYLAHFVVRCLRDVNKNFRWTLTAAITGCSRKGKVYLCELCLVELVQTTEQLSGKCPQTTICSTLHKHTLNPIIILNNKLNALYRKIEATVKHSQRRTINIRLGIHM